jgi:3-oxoacyl-[acyl-carrier-protein] synthase-1/3-oxoacyl-[acyl-carrier-protein] synthase II
MKSIALVAAGAISSLGTGRRAWSVGEVGAEAKTAIARDQELSEVGLRRPFAARVRDLPPGDGDRAARLLRFAATELARALDARLGDWRSRRVALAIGTSGGGMPSQTRSFALLAQGAQLTPELAQAAPYFGPLVEIDRALEVALEPRVQVLAACASSTVALGLGARWLDQDVADIVIAGGYDALSPFIAAGFEVLGATSEHSRPFRADRDGMALGEGAALVALMRAEDAPSQALGFLRGFGAASDAVHVTAPDRQGRGLTRAAQAALDDAALAQDVDIVSAHGTATPFNDAAEAKAMHEVLAERAARVVVHPFKAVIGHTLGAAGALELLAALDAIERGILPATVGSGPLEPELHGRLLEQNTRGTPAVCLKLSAAFGGANAALVAASSAGSGTPRARRAVMLSAVGEPVSELDLEAISAVSQHDRGKLARLDPLSALAVSAVARTLVHCGPLPAGTGVVVGSVAATVEINELFDRRCRERGHRAAEPRRFPPTSPNLCAGECSIAFGLVGPSLTVGAGLAAPLEALLVAHDLLQAGDAPALIVVAVDQVGEVVGPIWRAAGWPTPEHGAVAVVLTPAEGRRLERGELVRRHAAARQASGRLGETAPGWPALLAALKD